jgi:hypothetical protein
MPHRAAGAWAAQTGLDEAAKIPTQQLFEVFGEKAHRPAPGKLRRRWVMLQERQVLRVRRLIGEGMLCVVPVELEIDAGAATTRALYPPGR